MRRFQTALASVLLLTSLTGGCTWLKSQGEGFTTPTPQSASQAVYGARGHYTAALAAFNALCPEVSEPVCTADRLKAVEDAATKADALLDKAEETVRNPALAESPQAQAEAIDAQVAVSDLQSLTQ